MNPVDALAYDASLTDYQWQAESLLSALQAGDSAAQWRFKWMHPRFQGQQISEVKAATLDIDDSKLLIAREYFFEDWQALSRYTDAVRHDGPVRRFEQAIEAVVSGDDASLRMMLKEHPELAQAHSTRTHHATLLHYVGANGVEGVRQKTPPQAVEVAKTLLNAGADPDALADMYDHQCTTMSMLVSSCHPHEAGLQIPLAETLLDHGASLNGPGSHWQSALLTALKFGYPKTAEALVKRGAPVDNLVVAAGLGYVNDVARLLPTADSTTRHRALSLAAQLGQASTLQLLLDAGEDPNRLNPDGFHSHSTPLHQAVWANHLDVVKLLVERGARPDIRDSLYDGTPLDWAVHGNRKEMVEYLRNRV